MIVHVARVSQVGDHNTGWAQRVGGHEQLAPHVGVVFQVLRQTNILQTQAIK